MPRVGSYACIDAALPMLLEKPIAPTVAEGERLVKFAEAAAAYQQVLTRIPFLRYFSNSVLVAAATTLGHVFFDTLAAYAFARLAFRGKNLLFLLFMATMMITPEATIIPRFLMYKAFSGDKFKLPYIGDVAEVRRMYRDPTEYARCRGERAILLSVEMQEGNNIVDFGKERGGRQHDAVAHKTRDIGAQDAGGNEAQDDLAALHDDRVAGVISALVPDDVLNPVPEQVGRLTFTLVAPLSTDNCSVGHDQIFVFVLVSPETWMSCFYEHEPRSRSRFIL